MRFANTGQLSALGYVQKGSHRYVKREAGKIVSVVRIAKDGTFESVKGRMPLYFRA